MVVGLAGLIVPWCLGVLVECGVFVIGERSSARVRVGTQEPQEPDGFHTIFLSLWPNWNSLWRPAASLTSAPMNSRDGIPYYNVLLYSLMIARLNHTYCIFNSPLMVTKILVARHPINNSKVGQDPNYIGITKQGCFSKMQVSPAQVIGRQAALKHCDSHIHLLVLPLYSCHEKCIIVIKL